MKIKTISRVLIRIVLNTTFPILLWCRFLRLDWQGHQASDSWHDNDDDYDNDNDDDCSVTNGCHFFNWWIWWWWWRWRWWWWHCWWNDRNGCFESDGLRGWAGTWGDNNGSGMSRTFLHIFTQTHFFSHFHLDAFLHIFTETHFYTFSLRIHFYTFSLRHIFTHFHSDTFHKTPFLDFKSGPPTFVFWPTNHILNI